MHQAGGASFLESGSSSALLNVYHIATRFPEEAVKHRGHLVREYLVTDKVARNRRERWLVFFFFFWGGGGRETAAEGQDTYPLSFIHA